VTATLPDSCGETPRSTAVAVTTPPGPAGRPARPTDLTLIGNAPLGVNSTAITLSWTASPGGEPTTGYRIYEGATLAGTATGTQLSLTVGAGTRHTYTVVAVDAAGTESVSSAPLAVQAMYLPPP
jgi:hypothetical protein